MDDLLRWASSRSLWAIVRSLMLQEMNEVGQLSKLSCRQMSLLPQRAARRFPLWASMRPSARLNSLKPPTSANVMGCRAGCLAVSAGLPRDQSLPVSIAPSAARQNLAVPRSSLTRWLQL